jgi:magnesium transporter
MLVNCVAYQDGKRLGEIKKEQISEYVGHPECFVWVAIKDPTAEELGEMKEEFGLHELAVEDARSGHQRPKVDEYGNALFVVLHVPVLKDDEIVAHEVDLFVGKNYVLSVRHGFEPGFAAVRERTEMEPELLQHGSGFVFYAIMDNVVDRYFPIVDKLEVELEHIEERIFTEDSPRKNIQQLYALKHKLMVMRHAVEPLIEVVHKLVGGRVPQVCTGVQDYFRDIYDHLLRVSQQLDGLRDMVVTAMSVNLSMITLGEGEVTKKLAAYAALVAVPTMIAGIYGMNFKEMPELSWAFGYPMSIAIMAILDAILFLRFRKAGWL